MEANINEVEEEQALTSTQPDNYTIVSCTHIMSKVATTALAQAKKTVRKQIQRRLKQLEPATVAAYSKAIASRVLALPQVTDSQRISLYLNLPSAEVTVINSFYCFSVFVGCFALYS